MSAFEPHVVAVEWVGINSGLTGSMNQISGGMTNLARQQQQFGRQAGQTFGYWSQQMRIMRRSAEYMLAGFASYKIIQAFQNFRQFRSELGTLNANLNVGQGALNQWGQSAIDISNRTATPVNQILESFQNLAASFPELHAQAKAHLFPVMAEIEAKAANILSTSSGTSNVQPQQFGATVLQAARSFHGAQAVTQSVASNPGGRNLLEQTASQVVTALMRTPGTTGSQLISYLPTLFGGARAGKFSIPEAMGLFTTAQRVGGRPAQTIQYLRQLMLRIRRPTAQELPFFQQAFQSQGMDINKIGSYRGMQIINALLAHAASLPGGVTRKQIQQMRRQGNTQGVNLSGDAAQFLQNAVGGRIQSLVAITQLSTAYGNLNKDIDRYRHHLVDVNQANQRWLSQNALQQASNRMSNFSLTLINSFNPLINVLARTSGHIADWATRVVRHLSAGAGFLNRRTHGGLGYAADAGIIYALRAGLPPGIGNALGRIPGVGRLLKPIFQMTQGERGLFGRVLGRGAGAAGSDIAESKVGPGLLAKAFSTAISGPLDISAMSSALGGQANGTPVAPFWVVIHPLSRATVPTLFGMGPNSPTGIKNLERNAEHKGESSALNRAMKILRSGPASGAEGAAGAEGLALGGAAVAVPGAALAAGLGTAYLGSRLTAPMDRRERAQTLLKHQLEMQALNYGAAHHFRKLPEVFRYFNTLHGDIPRGLVPVFNRYARGDLTARQTGTDIVRYARRNILRAGHIQMTEGQANAFYKYIDPIYNLGNRTRFIHQATQQGGFAGYADLVVELQPTQELKDLVKPPQRKVHVRVPITNSPTQRGGRQNHRSK